jgi:5-methylcytosine-specific restriction endonuclease McrA
VAGIHSATYQRDRAQKRKEWKAAKRRCHVCLEEIDYDAPKTDPMHFQLDHIKSRKVYPELADDPMNWAPSHARCNKKKHTSDVGPALGETSETW